MRELRFLKWMPAIFWATCLLVHPEAGRAQTTVTYTGDAAAVSLDVLGIINVSVSNTGALPEAGGALSVSLLDFQAPRLLDLDLLSASTEGSNNQTVSQASVANVSLAVAGIDVTASVLTSNAAASCSSTDATATGSSTIADLKVNGLSVVVTGEPNQTVPLIVGSLIINQQISSIEVTGDSASGEMQVNALHLRVEGIADVVISSSLAGVTCEGQPLGLE